MCVWKLAPEQRLCMYCNYHGGCESRSNVLADRTAETFAKYRDTMNEMMGEDVFRRCRQRNLRLGRHIVIYRMMYDGIPPEKICKLAGLHRTTMYHSYHFMETVFEHPTWYKYEMKVYDDFVKRIGA